MLLPWRQLLGGRPDDPGPLLTTSSNHPSKKFNLQFCHKSPVGRKLNREETKRGYLWLVANPPPTTSHQRPKENPPPPPQLPLTPLHAAPPRAAAATTMARLNHGRIPRNKVRAKLRDGSMAPVMAARRRQRWPPRAPDLVEKTRTGVLEAVDGAWWPGGANIAGVLWGGGTAGAS